jgi:Cu/Ag efflux protein CusF
MNRLIRPVLTALIIACATASFSAVTADRAMAQQGGAPQQLKQMALTQKQIDSAVTAEKDMEALTSKMQPDVKPDPKVLAQVDATAKKAGFANTDEYYSVMDNISLVYSGIDPATKKYVGPEAVIKSQIAEVNADKKMSANDKKQALEQLNQALKEPGPAVENKGNIDLVVKNYDKLSPIMNEDQQ